MFSSKDFEVLKQVNRDLSGKTQLYKDSINDFDVSIFEVNGLKIFIFEEGNQKEHFSLYFTCNESELVINTIIDRFPAEICLRKEQLPCDSSIHTLAIAKEKTIDIISDFVKSIVLESKKFNIRSSHYYDPSKFYEYYPPVVFKSERKWTTSILSAESELKRLFEVCDIDEEILRISPELHNVDLVVETSQGVVLIEAMDQNGLCDEDHLIRGLVSYPELFGESCHHAILIAAEFMKKDIDGLKELRKKVEYDISLIVAEIREGTTKYLKEFSTKTIA